MNNKTNKKYIRSANLFLYKNYTIIVFFLFTIIALGVPSLIFWKRIFLRKAFSFSKIIDNFNQLKADPRVIEFALLKNGINSFIEYNQYIDSTIIAISFISSSDSCRKGFLGNPNTEVNRKNAIIELSNFDDIDFGARVMKEFIRCELNEKSEPLSHMRFLEKSNNKSNIALSLNENANVVLVHNKYINDFEINEILSKLNDNSNEDHMNIPSVYIKSRIPISKIENSIQDYFAMIEFPIQKNSEVKISIIEKSNSNIVKDEESYQSINLHKVDFDFPHDHYMIAFEFDKKNQNEINFIKFLLNNPEKNGFKHYLKSKEIIKSLFGNIEQKGKDKLILVIDIEGDSESKERMINYFKSYIKDLKDNQIQLETTYKETRRLSAFLSIQVTPNKERISNRFKLIKDIEEKGKLGFENFDTLTDFESEKLVTFLGLVENSSFFQIWREGNEIKVKSSNLSYNYTKPDIQTKIEDSKLIPKSFSIDCDCEGSSIDIENSLLMNPNITDIKRNRCLSKISLQDSQSDIPTLISNSSTIEFWSKSEREELNFMTQINFAFTISNNYGISKIKSEIFKKLLQVQLKKSLESKFEDYRNWGIKTKIVTNFEGIELSLKGFSETFQELFKMLINTISENKESKDLAKFEEAKIILTETLTANSKIGGDFEKLLRILTSILKDNYVDDDDIVNNLANITMEEYNEYTTSIINKSGIKALLIGNVREKSAKEFFAVFNSSFENKNRSIIPPSIFQVRNLEKPIIFEKDKNSLSQLWYIQFGEITTRQDLMMKIMANWMNSLAKVYFQKNNALTIDISIKTLSLHGYQSLLVYFTPTNFNMNLNSDEEKAEVLDNNVLAFLKSFYSQIRIRNEGRFHILKMRIQSQYLQRNDGIKKKSQTMFDEIKGMTYNFDKIENLSTAGIFINRSKFIKFYEEKILKNKNFIKIRLCKSSKIDKNGQLVKDNEIIFNESDIKGFGAIHGTIPLYNNKT